MAAHNVQFRVYYEDTDAGGIVYHARYLGFAERARAEALRDLGMPVGVLAHDEGIGFVVRHLDVRYHAPLQLDELLDVETILLELGAARLTLRQTIVNCSRGRQLAVSMVVELACIRRDGMTPTRIGEPYRALLQHLAVSS